MSRRYTGIAKDILFFLALAGVAVIASTSPYFLWGLLKRAGRNSYNRNNASSTFSRLKSSKLIKISKNRDGSVVIELTQEGKHRVKELQLYHALHIRKPAFWDRIWRIVIFDIPNTKKVAREALRQKLKKWNFYQLQESVWVCPWPCGKEIEFVSKICEIKPFVKIIEAQRIQGDEMLRKYFHIA